jgi:hypothetical protein
MRVIGCVLTEEVAAIRGFAARIVERKGSVDFVGGDMIESTWDSYVAVLLRMTMPAERFPAQTRGLKKGKRTHYIGPGKCERILDRAVDMGLCRKMYDTVDLFLLHELADGIEVADIQPYKLIVRPVLDILEIGKVTGISKFINIDNAIFRVLVYQQPYYMAAYEAGSAGYEDCPFHYNKPRRYCPY